MKKNLQLFWLFSKYSYKTIVLNFPGTLIFLAGKLLRFGMLFLFLYVLLSHTKVLIGFSIPQTMIFFLTFSLIDNLSQLLFREVYRFRPLVVSGELDTILVKPFHPFLRILLGGFDFIDFVTLFPYTLLLIYFMTQLSNLNMFNILLYIAFIFLSLIIAAAIHIIILALGILSTGVDNTIMIYRDLTRLAMVPVDVYQEPIRFFITFVIPIGLMMSVPAKALFGLVSLQLIAFSCMISVIAITIALLLWDHAIKKYQSWGG